MNRCIFLLVSIVGVVCIASTSSASAALSPSCLRITKNLRVGSVDTAKGAQVSKLQMFLKSQGYSVGVTGVYDSSTAKAVGEFQLKQGILGGGVNSFVGVKTRKKIREVSGCTATQELPVAGGVKHSTVSSTPVHGKTADVKAQAGTPDGVDPGYGLWMPSSKVFVVDPGNFTGDGHGNFIPGTIAMEERVYSELARQDFGNNIRRVDAYTYPGTNTVIDLKPGKVVSYRYRTLPHATKFIVRAGANGDTTVNSFTTSVSASLTPNDFSNPDCVSQSNEPILGIKTSNDVKDAFARCIIPAGVPFYLNFKVFSPAITKAVPYQGVADGVKKTFYRHDWVDEGDCKDKLTGCPILTFRHDLTQLERGHVNSPNEQSGNSRDNSKASPLVGYAKFFDTEIEKGTPLGVCASSLTQKVQTRSCPSGAVTECTVASKGSVYTVQYKGVNCTYNKKEVTGNGVVSDTRRVFLPVWQGVSTCSEENFAHIKNQVCPTGELLSCNVIKQTLGGYDVSYSGMSCN